VVAERLKAAVC